MGKAIILGTLAYSFPKNILNDFMKMEGVTDADLIFGPYDFYVMVQTEITENLTETAIRIRLTEGVLSTITCHAVDLTVLRPCFEEEVIQE